MSHTPVVQFALAPKSFLWHYYLFKCFLSFAGLPANHNREV